MLKKPVLTAVLGILFGLAAHAQPRLTPMTAPQSYGEDPQANIGSTVTDPAMTPAPNAQRLPSSAPPPKSSSDTADEALSVESQDSRIEATRKEKSDGQKTDTQNNPNKSAVPGATEWRHDRD